MPGCHLSSTARKTASLTGAVLSIALAAGCGSSSTGDRIDVRGLEQELAGVIHLEKLVQGFDFDHPQVSCAPSGSDGLVFECHVDLTSPNKPTNSWTVVVTCRPPGEVSGQRCTSDNGEALQ